MDETPTPNGTPESHDTAQLMGIIVGIITSRLSTGMPQLLEVLGPSWITSRLNLHRLYPALDSLINELAARDKAYLRECMGTNFDRYRESLESSDRPIPPLQNPPTEVIELIAAIRSIVSGFDFSILQQQSPPPHADPHP